MPLELIVISLMRTSKWINVLMMNSPEDDSTGQRRIVVTSNGIRWIEQDFEQFTPLGKFFEINTNPEEGLTVDKETDSETAMKISLLSINDEALEKHTVNVVIEGVHLQLNESMACGLQCSNCYKDLVDMRRFNCIRPMPIYTLKPTKYFCSNDQMHSTICEGDLYYALNYIVISPMILGKRVIRNREHLHCSRCLQLVGESLGEQMAVQLFVDTLFVSSRSQHEVGRLEHLFDQLTVSQLMLHLLHDAVPISEEKTRLFLKTVRSDGQLHYMLLLVDTSQLHLLRSKLSLSEHLNSTNGRRRSPKSYNELEPEPKRQRLSDIKPVHEVEVRGFRGCRISYHIFSSDEQLAANDELIEQWHKDGTPMLRISYAMMMDLHRELKINETLVAKMERSTPDVKEGRTSYIIYHN
ncbi:uncharacterized protein LOC117791096 [Drosophila innubila]|uniref:uncharacterized protein LOC117791096 n=1 Tax=Drosophila innubila TaxID=198719 RepID=UPI00148DCAFB|nr:uncharacterized protein LOC117791096 [Drosophila innubila]